MEKSDSDTQKESTEQELERLRKENAKLKSTLKIQKETGNAKIKALKKELKKKDVATITVTEEQCKLLSNLFPDIDSLFS